MMNIEELINIPMKRSKKLSDTKKQMQLICSTSECLGTTTVDATDALLSTAEECTDVDQYY